MKASSGLFLISKPAELFPSNLSFGVNWTLILPLRRWLAFAGLPFPRTNLACSTLRVEYDYDSIFGALWCRCGSEAKLEVHVEVMSVRMKHTHAPGVM